MLNGESRLAYLVRLGRSSTRIIRKEGLRPFFRLFTGWIGGKRGAYRPDERPQPITYAQFQQNEEAVLHAVEAPVAITPQFDIHIINADFQTSTVPDPQTLKSLRAQTYPHWQLYDNASPATADYLIIIQSGDAIPPYALQIVVQAIQQHPQADYFYSDEDEITPDKTRHTPLFKPDWSPEIMLSYNIMAHLAVCRRSLWDQIPASSLWDFALHVMEQTQRIQHIPHILYHRTNPNPPPDLTAISQHLERTGLQNPVVTLDASGQVCARWDIPQPGLVSIIIPSKDKPDFVSKCLATIFTITDYANFQVVLVDTGSTQPETHALYAQYADERRFKLVDYTEPFNFSRACNFGATHADGDLLLFLNNDTEILQRDWLHGMAQWFERDGVGIVGPKLLYPDGHLQHIGVIIGLHGLAGHHFALADEHSQTLFGSDDWYRNYLAVTGACLMISRTAFEEVGGFEESYKLNYSDVELCLAAHQAGYRIVYTPHVRLLHHESATHQKQIPIEDTYLFNERLQIWLQRGDPYYNPNLTYAYQIPEFKRHPGDTPAHQNQIMMAAVKRKLQEQQHANSHHRGSR